MKLNASEFMQTTKPTGRGAIKAFLPDLVKLRDSGYSLSQLQEFLTKNGIEVSVPTIHAYLKTNITREQQK